MITMYQELIPLSNKMYDAPISKSSVYTNPVIIPFVFDTTGSENIMETVIYLRNDSQEQYYSNIVICLMKEGEGTPALTTGNINFSNLGRDVTFSLNGINDIKVEPAFLFSQSATGSLPLTDQYMTTYIPVEDDGKVSVKLSYGYDELSFSEWESKSSIIAIPSIGTSGMADTSYIPIRMRMVWKDVPSLYTIRDYFIDVSYSMETTI
jgi:hypothetical protein